MAIFVRFAVVGPFRSSVGFRIFGWLSACIDDFGSHEMIGEPEAENKGLPVDRKIQCGSISELTSLLPLLATVVLYRGTLVHLLQHLQ